MFPHQHRGPCLRLRECLVLLPVCTASPKPSSLAKRSTQGVKGPAEPRAASLSSDTLPMPSVRSCANRTHQSIMKSGSNFSWNQLCFPAWALKN